MMSVEHFLPGTDVAVHVRAADGKPFCYRSRTGRNPEGLSTFMQLVSTTVVQGSGGSPRTATVFVPRRQLTLWEDRTAPTATGTMVGNHTVSMAAFNRFPHAIALVDLVEWARAHPDAVVWPDTADQHTPEILRYLVAVTLNSMLADVPRERVEAPLDWPVVELIDAAANASMGILLGFVLEALSKATARFLPLPELPLPGVNPSPAQKAFAPLAAILATWHVRDLVAEPQRVPEPPPGRSRLGIPTIRSRDDVNSIMQQSKFHVRAAGRPVRFDIEGESERVAAMRRWVPGQPIPDRLVPGDVSALRVMCTKGTQGPAAAGPPTTVSRQMAAAIIQSATGSEGSSSRSSIAPALVDAVPYFVPSSAISMLEAEPPSPDISHDLLMPHDEMLVVWADPLEMSAEDAFLPAIRAAHLPEIWVNSDVGPNLRLAPRTCLVGLLMFADPATRRPAEVSLIALVESIMPIWDGSKVTSTWDIRFLTIVASEWQDSDLAGLVDNVLALVDYSLWDEPEVVDLPADPKQRRKALKQSKTRRGLLRGGGVDRLRVMALGRTAQKQARTAGMSTGEPKAPHLRRGHWRRQRVGPRDAWWHETRYIGPVIVNADLLGEGEVPRGRTIWMVPKART